MESAVDKLNRFLDFIYNDEGLNPDDIKEALYSYDIDVEELTKDGLKFIESLEKMLQEYKDCER